MLVTHRGQRMKIRVYLVLVFQLDFFLSYLLQILFISGLALVIGLERTFRFFFSKTQAQGKFLFSWWSFSCSHWLASYRNDHRNLWIYTFV